MPKTHKSSRSKRSSAKRLAQGVGTWAEAIESRFKGFTRGLHELGEMLVRLVVPQKLVKQVDRASAKRARKLGKQVGELTDRVEKRFTKGASGLGATLQHLGAVFLPAVIRKPIARGFAAVWKRSARFFKKFLAGFDNLAERYLPAWLVRRVKRRARRLRLAFRSVVRFWVAWGKSRDYRKLAWSTPAAVLALPLAACVALSPVYSSLDKINHYSAAYGKALEKQQFHEAQLFAQKLAQLGYQRMERAEYREAISLAQAGQYAGAFETMSSIAPEDEPGYLYGHLWIATSLRKQRIPGIPEAEAWRLIEAHVHHASTIEPGNTIVRYLNLKLAQRAGISVIPQMKQLASEYEELYGELWVHFVQAGDLANARSAARRYSAYVERMVPEDRSIQDYMLWASAQEMLGNVEASKRITVEGGVRFQDAPELKKMAAVVLLAELRTIDQTSDKALDLLRQAHIADAENESVRRNLGSRLATDNTYKVRRIVDELKARRQLSGEVLLVAGDVQVRLGRYESAQEFYLEACEYDEKSGRGFNNIAWIYANVPPVQLEVALGAVQQAIDVDPDPEFFETRGQIFFKRGKADWPRAAADLELALNGNLPESDRRNAHRSLAVIYEDQGEPERAASHRRRAMSERVNSRLALQP